MHASCYLPVLVASAGPSCMFWLLVRARTSPRPRPARPTNALRQPEFRRHGPGPWSLAHGRRSLAPGPSKDPQGVSLRLHHREHRPASSDLQRAIAPGCARLVLAWWHRVPSYDRRSGPTDSARTCQNVTNGSLARSRGATAAERLAGRRRSTQQASQQVAHARPLPPEPAPTANRTRPKPRVQGETERGKDGKPFDQSGHRG